MRDIRSERSVEQRWQETMTQTSGGVRLVEADDRSEDRQHGLV